MPDDLMPLEFSLEDRIDGLPLTPETVDLPTLRRFLEEVETLVKGNVLSETLSQSRVRIEEGSLKVRTLVTALLAANVAADLGRLAETAISMRSSPSARRSLRRGKSAPGGCLIEATRYETQAVVKYALPRPAPSSMGTRKTGWLSRNI